MKIICKKAQNKGENKVKKIKWNLLIYSILSAASIMGIGISIAEKSVFGALSCVMALLFFMGLGFTTKRKMREGGKL